MITSKVTKEGMGNLINSEVTNEEMESLIEDIVEDRSLYVICTARPSSVVTKLLKDDDQKNSISESHQYIVVLFKVLEHLNQRSEEGEKVADIIRKIFTRQKNPYNQDPFALKNLVVSFSGPCFEYKVLKDHNLLSDLMSKLENQVCSYDTFSEIFLWIHLYYENMLMEQLIKEIVLNRANAISFDNIIGPDSTFEPLVKKLLLNEHSIDDLHENIIRQYIDVLFQVLDYLNQRSEKGEEVADIIRYIFNECQQDTFFSSYPLETFALFFSKICVEYKYLKDNNLLFDLKLELGKQVHFTDTFLTIFKHLHLTYEKKGTPSTFLTIFFEQHLTYENEKKDTPSLCSIC